MRGDPWGNTAHSALRWAYGLMARGESIPNIFGEMSSKTRVRTGMTMLDHRAQGAIIRSIVDRHLRGDIAREMVVAYYLPPPVKEKKAGGGSEIVDRFAIERRHAIHAIGWWLLGQRGTGAHSLRAMMEIVAQHSLGRGGARRLSGLMRKRMTDVLAARQAAFSLLDQQRQRAVYRAEDALVRAGLVEVFED